MEREASLTKLKFKNEETLKQQYWSQLGEESYKRKLNQDITTSMRKRRLILYFIYTSSEINIQSPQHNRPETFCAWNTQIRKDLEESKIGSTVINDKNVFRNPVRVTPVLEALILPTPSLAN